MSAYRPRRYRRITWEPVPTVRYVQLVNVLPWVERERQLWICGN